MLKRRGRSSFGGDVRKAQGGCYASFAISPMEMRNVFAVPAQDPRCSRRYSNAPDSLRESTRSSRTSFRSGSGDSAVNCSCSTVRRARCSRLTGVRQSSGSGPPSGSRAWYTGRVSSDVRDDRLLRPAGRDPGQGERRGENRSVGAVDGAGPWDAGGL